MKTVMVMNMLIKKLLMFLSAHLRRVFSCWDGQKRVIMLPSELSMFIPKVSTSCRNADQHLCYTGERSLCKRRGVLR